MAATQDFKEIKPILGRSFLKVLVVGECLPAPLKCRFALKVSEADSVTALFPDSAVVQVHFGFALGA